MQFLVLTTRKTSEFDQQSFDKLVGGEMAAARDLYGAGFIRQLWHKADGSGACQIFEANNADDVRQHLETLPFIRNKMLDVQVIALAPYRGFSNL